MPNQEELNIVLKLIDEASTKIKGAIGDASKEADKLNKNTEKANKSITDGFKEAGKQLKQFRQAAFAAAATIAVIIATTKEWAKHNEETKRAYDSLGVNIKEITALIGSLFAPTIIAVSNLIQSSLGIITGFFKELQIWYEAFFRSISFGTQYIVSFFSAIKTGVGIMEAHKIAIQTASRAVEEMSEKFRAAFQENIKQTDLAKIKLEEFTNRQNDLRLLYVAGEITAQEYYNSVRELQKSGIAFKEREIVLMNQLIELELLATNAEYQRIAVWQEGANKAQEYYKVKAELANQDLMNQQQTLTAATTLLQTVQSMHKTMWGSIFDFINMGIQKFSTGFSTALTSIIMGTKKAKDAFKEFGMSMISAIVEFVIQYAIQALISIAIGHLIARMVGNIADQLAQAWFLPAYYASVATFGGAALAGAAALVGGAVASQALMGAIAPSNIFGGGATGGTGAGGGFAEGGWIPEPVVGMGLSSGRRYTFGERGPEYVVPNDRLGRGGGHYIHIEINHPVIRSEDDIDKLTEEISRRIALEADRIR